jgi:AcrR family transcriptional regulator
VADRRRTRATGEETRRRILDATEEIFLKDGYAAVSSRSVATAVGIQPSNVHYYFPSLDDLFVAVLQRRAGRNVELMAMALLSPAPLRSWWDLASNPRGTSLFVEFLAAANHRPALKAEVGAIAREVRRMQMEVLTNLLPEYGIDTDEVPPALFAAAMQGLAFSAVQDHVAGYDTHAAEAIEAMNRLVDRLEQRRTQRR